MPIDDARRRELDERGFVRLEAFIAPERRQRLADRIQALFEAEGERAGGEFKQEPGARRLANLVDKGAVFVECIVEPLVLEHVRHVLGTRFKLSILNARSANPRNGASQPLHVDAGALPDERGFWVCNTVWMLDDFTPENGALRAVPGSHRWSQRPQDVLADPRLPHPDEVLVTGRAGDLVVDIWSLRGVQVDPGAIEAVREANAARPRERRVIDHGWTSEGNLWVAVRLPYRTGSFVFGVPGANRRFVAGRDFPAVDQQRTPYGTVRGSEEGTTHGYGPFLTGRGGDEDDILVVQFDLPGNQAILKLGDDELLEEMNPGA